MKARYVRNITVPFQEDDNLFIQALFLHFALNLGHDIARSIAKVEVRNPGFRRSSRWALAIPWFGAVPHDWPARPALQPSKFRSVVSATLAAE
jgi:hypothetical protein